MHVSAIPVIGRAAILDSVGEHPYVRMVTGHRDDLNGYRLDGTVAWTATGPAGPTGYVVGAAGPAVTLVGSLVEAGPLAGVRWLHLPRTGPDQPVAGVRVARRDDWDFRWTVTPPAPQPGEHRVEALTEADHPALADLIGAAFPQSTTRPGDPRVLRWYGIRSGDRLLACGADRSRGGVGFLAGICVAPWARSRGLGAALTAAMTRSLLARHSEVALGVLTGNLGANRIYTRLGFTGTLPRTSLMLD